ncbi:alpha/beta fold hydrolase [Actinopolyspora mortivallis]|uniref:Alpha/beta hydrolase n=1 Tax=Actinopolyspora mortivallis TaxID=33906 RepID=A0A2T0GUM0_ACTMO|nr:alpha/beta hydrolase [Actinopolyspora mortivallis]PRW62818.1 alpha/beta hydrolase [Actinopolyspora mortivallis]
MPDHVTIPTAAGKFDALQAGPPAAQGVLLLHGFPQSALQWRSQLAALGGAGYHAVAPDQRGYSPGVRPEGVEAYRMEELVGDVLAMADRLEWERFDLVGHDWGSAVAWATAAAAPDRIRTLSALSVPHPEAFGQAITHDPDQQRRSAYMRLFRSEDAERTLLAEGAQRLEQFFEQRVPAEHVTSYLDRMREPGALTAALNWYRAMRHAGAVGRITVPTLYVWSTEDAAVGARAAEATASYVTGEYRFEVLPGVSHWMSEEAPERVNELLLDHIGGHR